MYVISTAHPLEQVHAEALAQAVAQAQAIVGRTSPNPAVGAVVVHQGAVVGAGATYPPGGPHAERIAIAAAGDAARGADLYTTLEPCTFHGRTPPCTDAIIAAGIRRVFYVARDPDPRMNGGAARVLVAAGIATHTLPDPTGLVADQLAPFVCRVRAGRPLVTAKYAMTLDGRIATATGDSRWISGPTSRHQVHLLRDRVDAIMVGVGTILADDPELTTRLDTHWRPVQHPLRVIVDSQGRTPLTARVLAPTLPGQTLVATVGAWNSWVEAVMALDVQVEHFPADSHGRVSLPALLADLARRGVNHLLVEGGVTLLGALADARLIDQIWAFVGPKIVGGAAAPGPLGGSGSARMVDAQPFTLRRVEQFDQDTLLIATSAQASWWGNEEETDVHRDR